jgi:hypothetical protein
VQPSVISSPAGSVSTPWGATTFCKNMIDNDMHKTIGTVPRSCTTARPTLGPGDDVTAVLQDVKAHPDLDSAEPKPTRPRPELAPPQAHGASTQTTGAPPGIKQAPPQAKSAPPRGKLVPPLAERVPTLIGTASADAESHRIRGALRPHAYSRSI